jgi:S1-C subfamily serine protease
MLAQKGGTTMPYKTSGRREARAFVRYLFSAAGNLLVVVLTLASGGARALEPDKLFEKLSPSVWTVLVEGEGGRKSGGSAVVIAPEELITNCHVLAKGKSIIVKRENTMHGARLLHADTDRDLCILQVKGMAAAAVPTAALSSVKVGQHVYAIGSPLLLELTFSDGLISSLKKDDDGSVLAIQVTVPISPGSSGGGLFDADGRLVGITTASRVDGQNVNFALPAEWIRDVPERARVALEKRREQQQAKAESAPAVAAQSAAAAAAQNAPAERQLSGEELTQHVAGLRVFRASATGFSNLRLDFRPNGSLFVQDVERGFHVSGSHKLQKDQLCLIVWTTNATSAYKNLHGCYSLYETGPGKFTLRSQADNTFISYATN